MVTRNKNQRQKALAAFKNSEVDILVATDVAARGLDIKVITHVINYTIPQTFEDYIHRIGRTGRGMSTGQAYTFVG
jgi:superfamily II DNA/RNA helicase